MERPSLTDALASYAAAACYEQLPTEAIDAAKLVVLDTIGAMLLGSLPLYSASRLIGDYVRDLGGAPECTIVGRGFKADLVHASLANGVMGYAADAEGGGVVRQHAAAVLVPTALTVGEREHANGRTLIAALALGYDVTARIDRASESGVHYSRSFHRSAVFGHFGAAATAGHLLNLSQKQVGNALGLAGTVAGGLCVWLNAETEDSRPFVIGMAAHRGVLAAVLAKMGMAGPQDILDDGKFTIYDAFSGAMHLEEVTRDLGDVFWITRHTGFKNYPCCGGIHASLDALLKIVTENDLQEEEIVEIVDRVPPGDDDTPLLKSHLSEYILAVATVRREITPDTILVDYRAVDPRVRALFGRIRLIGDSMTTALGVSAIVEVRTKDGRTLKETVTYRVGDSRNPLSRAQILQNFFDRATSRVSRSQAEQIYALVMNLERLDDTSTLTQLLSVSGADAVS